ncbi:hypothetical protein LINPERHAP2_LOCUS28331 [Linum perenne]
MMLSSDLHLSLPPASPHQSSSKLLPVQNGIRLRAMSSIGRKTACLGIAVKRGSVNGGRGTEPGRNLFARKQRRTSQDYQSSDEANLEFLKSELVAVMETLKKKGEELEEAERKVESEWSRIDHMRKELERREEELAALSGKRVRLQEEIKQHEVYTSRSALLMKEDEMEKTTLELAYKSVEIAKLKAEIGFKMDQIHEVIKNQKIEIKELTNLVTNLVREKEEYLQKIAGAAKLEREKLKVSEENLKKQVMEELILGDHFSYDSSLRDAYIELEKKRAEVRVAQARNEELRRYLAKLTKLEDFLKKCTVFFFG